MSTRLVNISGLMSGQTLQGTSRKVSNGERKGKKK